MSNKSLWCLVGLLAAACAGEGYYIYSLRHRPASLAVADQDKWMSEARKALLKDMPIPFERFDELFNDRFFGRKFDPFAEIDEFRKRSGPLFSEKERSLFERSLGDWFERRMDIGALRPATKTTPSQVILSFMIPGLQSGTLKVDVNADRIRLAYDSSAVQSKKDEKGNAYMKSESAEHFEKVMPIPDGADPARYRVATEGDVVKIIFEKRKNGSGKA